MSKGFRNLGLKPLEEVKIIKGIKLWAVPELVTVIHEYNKFILLNMMFVKSDFDPDMPARFVTTCMNKADMLVGEAALKRVSDGKVFTGRMVGNYGYAEEEKE